MPTTPGAPPPEGAGASAGDRLYALFHMAFWIGPGVFAPFLFPLLAARGVTAPQLGLIAASTPLCALVAQPAVGRICDRTGRARRVLCLLAVASAVLLPLFAFAHGFWGELAVAAGFSLVNAPVAPLGDALTIAYLGPRAADYGRLRLWGSLSFAVAGTAAGLALHAGILDLRTTYLLAGAMLVPPAFLALCFPTELRLHSHDADGSAGRGASVALPGARPPGLPGPFLWFLGLAALNMLALNAQGTYFSVYVGHLGGGAVAQGLGWAIPAAVEAPFFLWAAGIERRLGIRQTLLLAFAFEVAALASIALARGPVLAVAGMTLQGPAFALFYGAAVPAVDRLVPPDRRASGQSLLWATSFGAGSVVANIGGALGVARLGLAGLYRALALFSLGATTLYWMLAPRAVPDTR